MKLTWDNPGDREFQIGIDKGVLYLPSGKAVPWNGLVSVSKENDRSTDSVYFEGLKAHDVTSIDSFKGILRAFTYPDEFDAMQGTAEVTRGIYVLEQPGVRFGLSYRTRKGNDLQGDEAGYKIHLVYNLTATPSETLHETLSLEEIQPVIFEWEISAVPEPLEHFRDASHVTIDSTKVDPFLMEELEAILYGTETIPARLPSISELIAYMYAWYRIRIYDNENGTWTARSDYAGYVFPHDPGNGVFTIKHADVTWINEHTFIIRDSSIIPQIEPDEFADEFNDVY